jgi:lipopolysaccharide transport system ATP-binding protein
MSDFLLRLDHVSKKFCKSFQRSLFYGLSDIAGEVCGLRNGAKSLRPQEFWALRDVSFQLGRGECLGILGRNGAGKSTLLRLILGKLKLDGGRVRLRGKLAAVSELGAGFNPIQTGKENVYNAAAIYGLSRKQADGLLEQIVDFAGVTTFIDSPIQNYSSGMRARLGYAVMAHLNPDVLLLDEVLAVGDLEFRRKCFRHLSQFRQNGGSLVLVSHENYLIQELCDRCVVLNAGEIVFNGEIVEGVSHYLQTVNVAEELAMMESSNNHVSVSAALHHEKRIANNRSVEIERLEIRPNKGTQIFSGSQVEIVIDYHSLDQFHNVRWGFTITTADQTIRITSGISGALDRSYALVRGNGTLQCTLPNFSLLPGSYCLKAAIADEDGVPLATLGWKNQPIFFSVAQTGSSRQENLQQMIGNLIKMDIDWQ